MRRSNREVIERFITRLLRVARKDGNELPIEG